MIVPQIIPSKRFYLVGLVGIEFQRSRPQIGGAPFFNAYALRDARVADLLSGPKVRI
jgi:hypothetical protein